jgi:hypothetical protein
LSHQNKGGWWIDPKEFYFPQGKSTNTTVTHLAELGASGDDPRIKKAVEYTFSVAQRENGGFAYKKLFLPCMNANLLRALIWFDYLDDSRTQKALKWLLHNQDKKEGTFVCEAFFQQKGYEKKQGIKNRLSTKNCFMTTIKPLSAYSFIPEEKRTKEIKNAIKLGAETILSKGVYKYKLDDKGNPASKPGWLKFGFPLTYNTDILETSYVLGNLGYAKDKRLKECIDIILNKQNEDGKWILEHKLSKEKWVDLEPRGKPSKWITLFAMRVLKKAFE